MQSGVTYRLVVRRGPQPNQQYPLTRDTLTIGRDITNDIVINDPEVSRHHARLARTPSGGYSLEDLRSTNGTFINRQRLSNPYMLVDGDLIGLGETVTLAFESLGGPQPGIDTVIGSGQPAPYSSPPPAQSRPVPPPMSPPPPAQSRSAPPPMGPPPMAPPAYEAPGQSVYPIGGDEEFDAPDNNRWIIIGCAVLTLVFCCIIVAALIFVDNKNLWCDIPIAPSLFNMFNPGSCPL